MRLGTIVLVTTLLGGCFPDFDALSGTSADAGLPDADVVHPEAGLVDAADVPVPPVDAGDAGGGNDAGNTVFVPNGSFETTGTGCGPGWNASNSTLETSPNSRTGVIACRVCRIGNPGAIQSAPMTIPAGPGNYRVSVWIRNSSTHLPSPSIVTSIMAMHGQTGVGGQPKAYAPQADYGLVQIDYPAPSTTDNLVVQLQNAAGADGSCFVVDDISIERLP